MGICSLCESIKNLKKDTINVLELYSGIGGMHVGLLDCGMKVKLNVTAIDINSNANAVYKSNFKSTKILCKNLSTISPKEFDELEIDICTLSPPCQPFSRNHSNQQFAEHDLRTESLHHLIKNVFPKLINKPKYFLIENVKNFEESKSAADLLSMFEDMNYNYSQFLLQPFQFGIPNSRLRYYCLAKSDYFCFLNDNSIMKEYPRSLSKDSCSNCIKMYFQSKDNEIIEHLEDGDYKLKIEKFEMKKISEYLDNENEDLDKFKLKPATVQKYLPAIDIVTRDSQSSNCFTSSYGRYFTGTGSFVLLNTPEMSINQIKELKKNVSTDEISLRKFKPNEIAKLMGFPSNFKMPKEQTLKQRYKLLGNSVNILVISQLLKILLINKSK